METTRFWQRSSFAVVLLFLLATAMYWPLVNGGFYGDDFFFLNIMRDNPDSFSRWSGMWSIREYVAFEHIWWKDPGWQGWFWRPLPSLVIEGSLRIFGENPFPLHLLAVLLHASIGVMLYLFVRMLGAGKALALLAGLFFVTCDDLSFPVGWIATITDIIGMFCVMIALILYVRWLQSRYFILMAASLMALILALASKESAVAVPPAMMLLSFLMPDGKVGRHGGREAFRIRLSTWIRRPMSWAPILAILVIYLVLYEAVPLGTMNNLLYIDPIADPGRYLSAAAVNLPALALGAFSVIPLFVILYWPSVLVPLAIAGVVISGIILSALRPFRAHPVVLWSLITFFLLILPQASTLANERGLYFPIIPAAILLAFIAASVRPIAKRLRVQFPDTSRWTRFVGWVVIFGLLLPGMIFSAIRPAILVPELGREERQFREACPIITERKPSTVIFLNAPEFMVGLYAWDLVNFLCRKTNDVWALCPANALVTLERTGDSSFVIRADRPGWVSNFAAKIFRVDPVLEIGRRYEKKDFTAIITEVTDDRSEVLAVRFEMTHALDDPDILYLRWNGRRFEPIDLSTMKIGETIELADTSDIMDLQ